jgi:hypothetical protein
MSVPNGELPSDLLRLRHRVAMGRQNEKEGHEAFFALDTTNSHTSRLQNPDHKLGPIGTGWVPDGSDARGTSGDRSHTDVAAATGGIAEGDCRVPA